MRDYHSYGVSQIGASEYAALIAVGPNDGLKTEIINFGGDGSYKAYVVDEDAEIQEHYRLVTEFKNWAKIYDDCDLTQSFRASLIKIYRAGDYGCIIQLIGAKEQ